MGDGAPDAAFRRIRSRQEAALHLRAAETVDPATARRLRRRAAWLVSFGGTPQASSSGPAAVEERSSANVSAALIEGLESERG
jgi:hypothetical protein